MTERFKCTERYSHGWTDPRTVYGSTERGSRCAEFIRRVKRWVQRAAIVAWRWVFPKPRDV